MKKTISITIAIKGVQNIPSLKKCVKSLLTQTFKPLEIIIVGEEEEISVIRFSSPKNSNINIRKIFASVDKNEARNIGILNSKGNYILYVDHDMRADKRLLENCFNKISICDALIIPEKSNRPGFWGNCKRLERELIVYDLHTVTPRFYKKSLFDKNEKPFDSKFGLLDEWGFSNKLMKKRIKLGYSDSFILVDDANFSVLNEIINKFKRGLWMKNFYHQDRTDAWARINPVKRGLLFYSRKMGYLIKEPKYFLGLIILKTLDFVAFMTGYLTGYLFNLEKKDNQADLIRHYDELKGGYLNQMYNGNSWTQYVDDHEKQVVLNLLRVHNNQKNIAKILDLGMGPGRWAKLFLDNNLGQVYGIDISPKMVEYAISNVNSKRFKGVVAKMDDLPLKDSMFDKVFCFRAIKYVDNVDRVLKEVSRVLNKDGIFILEVSNNSFMNRFLKFLSSIVVLMGYTSTYSDKWGYFNQVKFYTKESITNMLIKQRFEILEVMPLFILPSIPLPTFRGKLTVIWKMLDRFLLTVLPNNYFCRSWIVVSQKNGQ